MIAKSPTTATKRHRLKACLAAALAAGGITVSTGCSTGPLTRVASLNPFAKKSDDSLSEKKDLLAGPKSAMTKSRDAVAGWFGKSKDKTSQTVLGDENDPVSLSSKAEVSAEVFIANGRLWESTGNFEKAMESFAKALEKSPDDPKALANIGRLHYKQQNFAKAAEYFSKAADKEPENAGLQNDLGLTLSRLGNHNAAINSLQRSMQLAPSSSRFANSLASAQFESGDSAAALETLVKNNKPAVAHYNMAYLHFNRNQRSDAMRHLKQALAYGEQAKEDPAIERALERSRQLLTQLGEPGGPSTANIAAQPPSQSVQPASAQSNAPGNGMPIGATIEGFESLVQPASSGETSPSVSGAAFKLPQ